MLGVHVEGNNDNDVASGFAGIVRRMSEISLDFMDRVAAANDTASADAARPPFVSVSLASPEQQQQQTTTAHIEMEKSKDSKKSK